MRRTLAGAMVCCALVGSGEERWRGLVVAPEFRWRPPTTGRTTAIRGRWKRRSSAHLGDLYGPYTCTSFGSTRDTEIEHMVALSEAHDSGLCAADPDTRRRFARELRNLTVAAPSVNRSKGARDASEWLPDSNRCLVRGTRGRRPSCLWLTIDRREADALEAVLSRCPAGDVREPFCPAARSIPPFGVADPGADARGWRGRRPAAGRDGFRRRVRVAAPRLLLPLPGERPPSPPCANDAGHGISGDDPHVAQIDHAPAPCAA